MWLVPTRLCCTIPVGVEGEKLVNANNVSRMNITSFFAMNVFFYSRTRYIIFKKSDLKSSNVSRVIRASKKLPQ